MKSEAFFLNGVYRSVLEGILAAQEKAPDNIFYLQPYSTSPIANFRDDPPIPSRPTVLYASTTEDLPTVSYRAEIIGWKDKTSLDEPERQRIDREIRHWGYDPGIYGEEMVNLIFIRDLVRLDPPFRVTKLIKISEGKPLSDKRSRSGGWSYVYEKED